ncbi:response regulator [Dactylosporangium sp. NPDC051541]|uniref:response regulator n=1 Tax=Dactylosporangium sp. NPDC051541 TaxID=3363977 RepID=UPI0037AFCF3D
MAIRVLLADDEAMIRAGLRMVLEAEPDIEIVGEAGDGLQAVAQTTALRPDVVLMDVRMPRMGGLAAMRQLLAADPGVKVVVLTTFNEPDALCEALRLGASGFLLKVAPPERLLDAIRVAAGGDALLDPLVTRHVIQMFTTLAGRAATRRPDLTELTQREAEVLHMLARGLSNTEIAAGLRLGDATVKTHVARVLMKLHLRDRVQVVIYAYEHGLVAPDSGTG